MVANENRKDAPPEHILLEDDDIAFEDASDSAAPGALDAAALAEPLSRLPGVPREGMIYLISLANFRRQMGDDWPRARFRIRQSVENVLNDALCSKDHFLCVSDDAYLVSFAGNNPAHASLTAIKIARIIKDKLFGDGAGDAQVIMLTRDILAGAAAAPQDERMKAVAEHRRQIATRFAQVSRKEAPEYVFTPVWDAVHKVLSTYVCTPMQCTRSGAERYGAELLAPTASDIERASFYAQTLEFALDVAEDLYKNQFAVFISVQCDYLALSTPKSRAIYFSARRKIPQHLHKLLRVSVVGSDDTVPTTTLTERIGYLRPYFHLVSLRLSNLSEDLSRFSYMGLHAVSFPVGSSGGFDFDLAAAAIKQARSARIHFAFTRVPDLATADRLASLGATYLSGAFLGAALDAPENMTRCTLEDLGRMER